MMSQDYPEELSWLLSDDASHEMILFKDGRVGLAKIDCKDRNGDICFNFRTILLSEIYTYPGILNGGITEASEGYRIESKPIEDSEDGALQIDFKDEFVKQITVKADSDLEFIFLYFGWDETCDIELLIDHGFICEVKNKHYPIKFQTNRVDNIGKFNEQRNRINSHRSKKHIHGKQLLTLEVLKELARDGWNPHSVNSVAYVGTDDGSNFETSLSFLMEERQGENQRFDDLIIRAENKFDDLQRKSLRNKYEEFTNQIFYEDDAVQSHSDPWDSNRFDLIIDTYTIQSWGHNPGLLCNTISTFEYQLTQRIKALTDNGVLVLVFPETVSAFGKIYTRKFSDCFIDDDRERSWYEDLHHEKTVYFLRNIVVKIIMEKLENCELKIGTHQYNYIGGAIHIKKKVSDDYTTYQEEEVKVAEKSSYVLYRPDGWQDYDSDEDDWSFSRPGLNLILKDFEITNWRNKNE